tara:strand:- start:4940 stop:6049 length:1110 start_codon:yes stop_codon:yes gene_type:complete
MKPVMTSGAPTDVKPKGDEGVALAARVEAWASEVMGRLEGLEGDLSSEGAARMQDVHGNFQANVASLLEGIRSGAIDGAGASRNVGALLGDLKSGMADVRAEMRVDEKGPATVNAAQASKGAKAVDGLMRAQETRATNASLGTDMAQGPQGSSDMTPAERVAMLREQILERLGSASGIDGDTMRGLGEQLNAEFGTVLDGLADGTLAMSDVGPSILSSIRNLASGLQAPAAPAAPAAPEASAMANLEATDAAQPMSAAETTQIQERLADWADRTEHRLALLASSADGMSAGGVEATQETYMASLRDLSSAVANGSLSGADVASQMAQIMESLRGDLQELFPNADSGRLYGRDAMGTDAPGPGGQLDLSV